MKRIMGTVIIAATMMALVGCKYTDMTCTDTKISIEQLSETGYAVYADGSKGAKVILDFCIGKRYYYYRDEKKIEGGDYILSEDRYTIDMNATSRTGIRSINTQDGYLRVGQQYEVKGIETIDVYEIAENPCH